MEEKIIETIEKKIKKYFNKDFEELEEKQKERIYKIESFIQDNNKKSSELLEKIKGLKLTKVSIANSEEIGISRKTLYNDKVLQKYIEESIKDQSYYNNNKLNDLQTKYNELKNQYNKIINNVIEVNVLKIKIEEYEQKISLLTQNNEELKKIIFEEKNKISKIRSIKE